MDSNGLANPASATSGYKVAGRAFRTHDNTGAYSNPKQTLLVDRGVFQWGNASNVFSQANISDLAYVADDNNVTAYNSATGAVNIAVGRIVDVDTNGVWVDTRAR